MKELRATDDLAVTVTSAIRDGNLAELNQLLHTHEGLAGARIVDDNGVSRSLLHVAADWPGHFPNGAHIVKALVAAGADPNARVRFATPHGAEETPLHWAASSDDVDVVDALLDVGADIEASGAVFTGGTPMSDAVVFAQWRAARRLLERGARTNLVQAAALGLLGRVQAMVSSGGVTAAEITTAFWNACRGGHLEVAQWLRERGADCNWIGYDEKTPLRIAQEHDRGVVVEWLVSIGAR